MNQYQKYLELNAALEQLLTNFMQSNNLTSIELDNAISKFQLKLKDQIIMEFLIEAQTSPISDIEENTEEEIDG